MSSSKVNVGIALCLIGLAIGLRLAFDIPNFAPIGAVAIFGGALLPRRWAVAVPLAAIIASDLIIGLHDLILVTWGAYALITSMSSIWLSKKMSFSRGAYFAIASSIFFFLTTNFAVWLTSGMYPHTLSGLTECYVLALPFFRNTLASDLFYTGGLISIYFVTKNVTLAFLSVRQSELR